jgi:hypothetical protein
MSGTGSLMIRNLRKASDYDKARINQDELLKIAIANDNNISNARRSYRQGEVPALTPQQQQTPDEIQADISKNYSDAITNLLSLGMDYREASDIATRLGADPTNLQILNNTFPSIKTDFQKRFDVKRITATGFVEFFNKFREVFNETKGIADNSGLFNDKFDRIINNINDLRAIIPTRNQFEALKQSLRAQIGNVRRDIGAGGYAGARNYDAEFRAVLGRLDRIAAILPTDREFQQIVAGSDNTRTYTELAQLQNALANVPSRDQVQAVLDSVALIRPGVESDVSDLLDVIAHMVGTVSNTQLDALRVATEHLSEKLEDVERDVERLDSETETIAPYIDGNLRLTNNKIYWQSSGGDLVILTLDKMKQWYKNNTNRFAEWYDEHISGRGITWNAVKEYIQQNGVRRRIGSLGNDIIRKTPKRSSSTGSAGSTTGLSRQSSASSTPTSSSSSRSISPVPSGGGGRRTGHGIKGAFPPTTPSSETPKRIGVRKIGSGIAPVEEPTHIEFGKHLLHANNLRKGVLSLHHKGGGRVASIPVQKISEDLRDFIVDILQRKSASQKDFGRLPIHEQKLFEKFSTGAGVFHSLGLKSPHDDDDKKKLERFEVLRGEWMAGNNSHELVRELRKLVIHFMEEGRLTKGQARELLLNIN